MASLVTRPNGRREIHYIDDNRRRQAVRLGKMPKKSAESVKTHVEQLIVAKVSKQPVEPKTAAWVGELGDDLAGKLAKLGLIRERGSALLGAFVDQYIAGRTDVKKSTKLKYGTTRTQLLEFFDRSTPLRDITAGDVDDWRRHLEESLAENTLRKYISVAKQIFKSAKRHRLIEENPFDDQASAIVKNQERLYFVTREEADKVLEACPNNEWRLIFALARYGGLRCPSEHLALTWDCVDWERDRLRVNAPKTEHHEGKETRVVPLFPELKPYLEQAFNDADEGAVYILDRQSNANLRTHMLRIIKRAGLKAWPKVFQNLRSTRETELADEFPIHVVCEWIGNSQVVAKKHYLQVTDDHYAKGAHSAQQNVPDRAVSSGQGNTNTRRKSFPVTPGQLVTPSKVGVTGLEPVTSCMSSKRANQLRQTPKIIPVLFPDLCDTTEPR
jgi:integrase